MDLIAALLLFVAGAYASYAFAIGALPGERCSARLSAAVTTYYALLASVFVALSAVRAFRLAIALPVMLVLAAAGHLWARRRGPPIRQFQEDLHAARAALREVGRLRWIAVAAIPVLWRTVRGLVTPPLGWDALTYHLVKAGQWVQAGGFVPLTGPDNNVAADYFPPYGDVLWAWAMLPVRGDGLLALAGLAVWGSILVTAYACARTIGAGRPSSFLAALAIALTPAAASLVTGTFIDNAVLALLLAAASFGISAIESRRPVDAVFAALALGVLAGTKTTGFAVAIVEMLVVAALALLLRPRRYWTVMALAIAPLLAAPHYLRAWVEKHNPVYPFQLPFQHLGTSASVEVTKATVQSLPALSPLQLLRDLATPFAGAERFAGIPVRLDHLGFGPAILVLVPLGLFGAAALVKRRRFVPLAILLGISAALLATQLGDQARHLWVQPLVKSTQRYMLGVLGAFTLLAAVLDSRLARVLLGAAALCGGLLSWPRGIGPADLAAVRAALPALAAAALGCIAVWALAVFGKRALGVAMAIAFSLLTLAMVQPVREAHRYRVYQGAARQESFDATFLDPFSIRAWRIWAALDGEAPRRIAVIAGWHPIRSNIWFRYPLLGAHLQNEVVYVPPTADGVDVGYSSGAELERRADRRAWLRELVRRRVEFVVLLAPFTIESRWIQSAPQVFEPFATGDDRSSVCFKLEARPAVELLSSLERASAATGETR